MIDTKSKIDISSKFLTSEENSFQQKTHDLSKKSPITSKKKQYSFTPQDPSKKENKTYH